MIEKLIAKLPININRQKILQNASWLYLEKALRIVVGFFIIAWMARYLGPADFGLLSYSLAFVSFFEVFISLGMQPILKREIVLHPQQKYEYLGTGLILQLISALICFVAVFFISPLVHQSSQDLVTKNLVTILSFIILFRPFEIFEYWYETQFQAKKTTTSKIISLLFISFLRVVFILLQWSVLSMAFTYVMEMLVSALFLVTFYFYTGEEWRKWSWNAEIARKLLSWSWPIMLSGFTYAVYMKVDQFMLKFYATEVAIGHYAAAVKLSEIWYFIPTTLAASVFPIVIAAKQKNEKDFENKIAKIFKVMTYLFFAIALPITFLAPYLIQLIFKKDYAPSAAILQVHIWSGLFIFWGVAQSLWETANHTLRYSLIRSSAGVVMNIICNYFLIPRYAALGAAWANVISYCLMTTAFNLLWSKSRIIFSYQLRSFSPRGLLKGLS